jgi:hypothetical protein
MEFRVQIHLLPKEIYMRFTVHTQRKTNLKNQTVEVTYLGKKSVFHTIRYGHVLRMNKDQSQTVWNMTIKGKS